MLHTIKLYADACPRGFGVVVRSSLINYNYNDQLVCCYGDEVLAELMSVFEGVYDLAARLRCKHRLDKIILVIHNDNPIVKDIMAGKRRIYPRALNKYPKIHQLLGSFAEVKFVPAFVKDCEEIRIADKLSRIHSILSLLSRDK